MIRIVPLVLSVVLSLAQCAAAQSISSARGMTVLVYFTGIGCPHCACLVNERVTLDNPDVEHLLAQDRVVTLRGDSTNPDPAITAALHRFGRDGAPLYVLYTADGVPKCSRRS